MCNLHTPPFAAPGRVSQPDHHGDGWSADPPNTQGTRAQSGMRKSETHSHHFKLNNNIFKTK